MRQSKLFTKTVKNITQDEISINAQLLIKGGYIDKLMAGVYSFLPLGFKVLKKIEQIIREEMNKIEGQEILMPALHPKSLWEQTNRWNEDVMFHTLSQTNKEYGLGFTHEEVVTPLVGKFIKSYKDLPIYVYQIQTKFRDELRAKSGLLRGREFIMKDMYSFHANKEDLESYYHRVKQAYFNIFKRIGLSDVLVKYTFASGGSFSKFSHEFQLLAESGEDLIHICNSCGIAINKEIYKELEGACPECNNNKLSEPQKSIEIGNIFQLNTKFSNAYDLFFLDKDGNKREVLMGCYGIGLGRLMGAVVEISHDDNGIIWPKEIAPYQIHLLPIGDREEIEKQAVMLYNELSKYYDVLLDDRSESAGVKFKDADLLGIPIRIVISSKKLPLFELKYRDKDELYNLSKKDLIAELQKYYK